MEYEQGRKKPIQEKKVGRFSVSVWVTQRRFRARNDFEPERVVEGLRAVIRYKRFSKRDNDWEEQFIWCDSEELRDLSALLDALGDSGDDNPVGPSVRSTAKA